MLMQPIGGTKCPSSFWWRILPLESSISVQLQTASGLWVHSFPNASLPPECRDTFSCGRLGSEMMEGKTISEGGINVVAMVPVVKGVLLLVTESGMVSLWSSTLVSASFYQFYLFPTSVTSSVQLLSHLYPSNYWSYKSPTITGVRYSRPGLLTVALIFHLAAHQCSF